MMTEAATSRPSSVRRRALKARRGRLVVERRVTASRRAYRRPASRAVEPQGR